MPWPVACTSQGAGGYMTLSMLNASIVVLSDGNNPKLLNHDFLARNSIVPDDWRVHDVMVSPPFSNILYDNGVQFVVELNKLQVRVNRPDIVDPVQNLPRMMTEYLRVLPHVSYRGVGINFVSIVKDQNLDIEKTKGSGLHS